MDATTPQSSHELNSSGNFNAILVGTNIEPNYSLANGVIGPGSGACVRTIEEGCGKKAITVGKPQKIMFDIIINELGLMPSDVMMVGDQLITDIAFASTNGARSILVLSGLSKQKDADEAPENNKPTYVLPSLVQVAELLENLKNEDN